MNISLLQFKAAFTKFMKSEFTPNIPLSEYPMYFGKLAIINSVITKSWEKLATNGILDIDPFYESYSEMFELTDKIDIQGFTLNKNDIKQFKNMLQAEIPVKTTNSKLKEEENIKI